MADKFIIHGATFNGDGTSSAEATVNGGTGAWNTITYMEGAAPAYGTLAAGDRVTIRSKDAGGADITRVMGATVSLGSAAATVAAPITWVLDDGTVWPGVQGVLTYSCTVAGRIVQVLEYNRILPAGRDALKVTYNVTMSSHVMVRLLDGAFIDQWDIADNTASQSVGPIIVQVSGSSNSPATAHAKRCKIRTSSRWQSVLMTNIAGNKLVVVDPDIELTAIHTSRGVLDNADAADLVVHGGRIHGAGADGGSPLCTVPTSTTGGRIHLFGTQYPQAMPVFPADPGNGHQLDFAGIGMDGGSGAFAATRQAVFDSRDDGFYPTLNAAYPGSSATPWAWRLTPLALLDMGRPAEMRVVKAYYGAEVALDISLELLVHTGWTGVTRGNVWLDLTYTDATTGLPRMVSTQVMESQADLDSSTAAWSSTSWGAVGLVKRKLAVTTPTAVRTDTPIVAAVRWGAPRVAANNYAFICPDIQAVAA